MFSATKNAGGMRGFEKTVAGVVNGCSLRSLRSQPRENRHGPGRTGERLTASMLMLTHTWILREFLGPRALLPECLDLYAYNVCPDLLTFHPAISSEMTHGIDRFRDLPDPHRKAAFVHFHLLVDDIAHYGDICEQPVRTFNPDSGGYTYVRGRSLVEPIRKFQKRFGREVSPSEAAYQSHIMIETAFDMVLNRKPENSGLIPLFTESLGGVARNGIEEFGRTIEWLTDIQGETAGEAFAHGVNICTPERMNGLMNVEGRINLFIDKFGLDRKDRAMRAGAIELMEQGMELVRDCEAFLEPAMEKIRKSAFRCFL